MWAPYPTCQLFFILENQGFVSDLGDDLFSCTVSVFLRVSPNAGVLPEFVTQQLPPFCLVTNAILGPIGSASLTGYSALMSPNLVFWNSRQAHSACHFTGVLNTVRITISTPSSCRHRFKRQGDCIYGRLPQSDGIWSSTEQQLNVTA